MDVREKNCVIKVKNILFIQLLFFLKNNLNLEIIRGLQTECWYLEKIFRTDQRLQSVRAGRDFEFKFTCLDTESHRI